MTKVIEQEVYQRSHPLRMAFLEGRLGMCEEIKELAHILLVKNNASPYKPSSEFEEGQVAALAAIIEACIAVEESVAQQSAADTKYDA
jgi:hypothetical protein